MISSFPAGKVRGMDPKKAVIPRRVTQGNAARTRMLRGALKLARTVAVTYGPQGRMCLIDRTAGLLTTRDGATIAREITLADPVANAGAAVLKDAALKVNEAVGDGTTTVAILAAEMIRQGHKLITGGLDSVGVVAGMRSAAEWAVALVAESARPVATQADLEHVARLACNDDGEIARLMAEACMAVGRDGTVVIEDGSGVESVLELKEGMEIDRGWVSDVFAPEGATERVMEGPLVAVINADLFDMSDIKEVLEVGSQWRDKGREILIFCLAAGGEALATAGLNYRRQVVGSCIVSAPGFAHHRPEYLRDLAALTGATVADPAGGMSHRRFLPAWFGALRKATIRARTSTVFAYDEASETLQARIAELRAAAERVTSDYDRDRIRERLARLSGGMAVLKIGGVTEAALKERRARVETALGAVRAALRDGVVPGGGTAYARIGFDLGSGPNRDTGAAYGAGWLAVAAALIKPLQVLAVNAGRCGPAVAEALRTHDGGPNDGWDFVAGRIRDLNADPPIMDPAAVATTCIRTATSVATTLLTADVAITA